MAAICDVEGCERSRYAIGFCEMHYRRLLRTGDSGPPEPYPMQEARACRAPGCEHPSEARGLCHGHYQRLLRTGEVDLEPLRSGGRLCSVEGCDRPHKAKGLCPAHYMRLSTHGDPQADEPIRTVEGQGTIAKGYRYIPVPKDQRHLTSGVAWIGEHRLVMAKHLGRALRSDEHVHHINGQRSDNRLDNLELWSTYHPKGQRVVDLLEWAQVLFERYNDEFSLIDREKGPV